PEQANQFGFEIVTCLFLQLWGTARRRGKRQAFYLRGAVENSLKLRRTSPFSLCQANFPRR
ncbi:MAG: hypothetical protein E6Z60_14025, partial [Mixta calida]|nr:hypothetical protein [Mixta calida]